MSLAYVDTSAFVKLIVREDATRALRRALAGVDGMIASRLLRTEALRALRRSSGEAAIARCRQMLASIALIDVDDGILDMAATVDPASLRTLDAIHLATALTVQRDLTALYTYDARLAEAAILHGLPVAAPV